MRVETQCRSVVMAIMMALSWWGKAVGAAPDARELLLDGRWQLSVRQRAPGTDWSPPVDRGDVEVPGAYLPLNDKQNRETEVVLVRSFSVPKEWREACAKGARVLVEFDAVDYRSKVEASGTDGVFRTLGEHEGYFGRFAVQLGDIMEGRIKVSAWDLREGAGQLTEQIERTTLQGVDPTAWGKNPCGIVESVRLRLVGPVYMQIGRAHV